MKAVGGTEAITELERPLLSTPRLCGLLYLLYRKPSKGFRELAWLFDSVVLITVMAISLQEKQVPILLQHTWNCYDSSISSTAATDFSW